jgi:hypothetical protein
MQLGGISALFNLIHDATETVREGEEEGKEW